MIYGNTYKIISPIALIYVNINHDIAIQHSAPIFMDQHLWPILLTWIDLNPSMDK